MLSKALTDRGEDLLRLEYDVLSLFPTGNFDPDAPLDFNVHSQRFLDAVSNSSSALTEYESFGNYGSLIIDKNTEEYFYNLNTNIVRREMETGGSSWDYDLDMEGLFAGEELLDIFLIHFKFKQAYFYQPERSSSWSGAEIGQIYG